MRRVNILKIDSEEVEGAGFKKYLKDAQGVLIPGGFGARGIEGKIAAVKYVRENNIPFFGICLGMQIATIEFARNVAGLKGANSTEFDHETPSSCHQPDRGTKESQEYGRFHAPGRLYAVFWKRAPRVLKRIRTTRSPSGIAIGMNSIMRIVSN